MTFSLGTTVILNKIGTKFKTICFYTKSNSCLSSYSLAYNIKKMYVYVSLNKDTMRHELVVANSKFAPCNTSQIRITKVRDQLYPTVNTMVPDTENDWLMVSQYVSKTQ